MQRNRWRLKLLPAFLFELVGLEELVFLDATEVEWLRSSVKVLHMPKTLRKLHIKDLDVDMADFCSNKDGTILPMSQYMPLLTDLRMDSEWTVEAPWMKHMPGTLEKLKISSWCPFTPLPPSLTSFEYSTLDFTGDGTYCLPPKLTHLRCGEVFGEASILRLAAAMPHSLTSLLVEHNMYDGFSLQAIASLPRSILKLDILVSDTFSQTVDLADVAKAWPPALEHLSASYLPVPWWGTFPPTLKRFKHENSSSSATELSDPDFSAAWPRLPSFLTHISINLGQLVAMPAILPKFPIVTSLALHSLYLFRADLNELFSIFPTSLTKLKIAHIDYEIAKRLPSGLFYLDVPQAVLTPRLFENLPSSLTVLHLVPIKSFSFVIDPRTDEVTKWSDFKPIEPTQDLPDRDINRHVRLLPRLRLLTIRGIPKDIDSFLKSVREEVGFLDE